MADKNLMARISIDVTKEQHRLFKARAALSGKTITQFFLDAIETIPEVETWIYEPKNKDALESLQRGLQQEGAEDWVKIKKRLKAK